MAAFLPRSFLVLHDFRARNGLVFLCQAAGLAEGAYEPFRKLEGVYCNGVSSEREIEREISVKYRCWATQSVGERCRAFSS